MKSQSLQSRLIFLTLCFGLVFVFLISSLEAQTRVKKSSSRQLMEELSESTDEPEEISPQKIMKKGKKASLNEKKRNQKAEKTEKNNKKGKKGKKGKKTEEPEDLRTPEEKELDRMAYFRNTGIWLWPELTEEQLEMEIKRQKNYMEDVKTLFPKMIYYESEHFFYLTDAPEAIAKECLKYLEAMYTQLCRVFEFAPGKEVWKGKCIVCAFVFQPQFLQFEQKFFEETAQQFVGASGLAHLASDGNVLISLYYGDISTMEKRWQFIGTLVHETTHGFVHRCRARQSLPLWINEGIADFMAGVIVPADRQALLKQKHGLEMMRQTGSVGGLMSTTAPIEAWQYGVASGMVEFLIKSKPHEFRSFFDDLKDGKEWETTLKEHYGCTPEEFLQHFARANRIPRLTF